MMRKLLVLALLALCPVVTFAQTSENGPISTQFLLEVRSHPEQSLNFQQIGYWTWYAKFAKIEGWEPPPGFPIARVVRVAPTADGDAVKVRISILSGERMIDEYLVADRTVPGSQRITVDELKRFGIVPFEMSLARASATVAPLPRVENEAKSLSATVHAIQSPVPSFVLVVYNNSGKDLIAFNLQTANSDGLILSGWAANPNGALLVEGNGMHRREVPTSYRPTMVSTGERGEAKNVTVVTITSAVYGDGSFEGNIDEAWAASSRKLAEKIQSARIVQLLRAKHNSIDELASAIRKQGTSITDEDVRRERGSFKLAPRLVARSIEGSAIRLQKEFQAGFERRFEEFRSDPKVLRNWIDESRLLYKKWYDDLP